MDIRRLIEDCNAETVAEAIGMDITSRGKYQYILCPGHQARLGKPDNHMGNAVLWEKGYYCYACGCFVKTHDMVMEYTGCSSAEAYEIMAAAMGGVSLYEGEENHTCVPRLRLNKEEAEVIGLYPVFHVSVARKETEPEAFVNYEGLYDLYQENQDRYYRLITCRAKESLDKYLYLKEHYASAQADLAYVIYDLMGEGFDHCVYKKLSKELDLKVETCRKIIRLFGRKLQQRPVAN
ncbi:hypothetical protein VSQ48_20015 [Candidatus Ventrimonas sp. KK005]